MGCDGSTSAMVSNHQPAPSPSRCGRFASARPPFSGEMRRWIGNVWPLAGDFLFCVPGKLVYEDALWLDGSDSLRDFRPSYRKRNARLRMRGPRGSGFLLFSDRIESACRTTSFRPAAQQTSQTLGAAGNTVVRACGGDSLVYFKGSNVKFNLGTDASDVAVPNGPI